MKKVFALAVAVLAVTMISSQGALGQSPDCSTITPQGGGSLTDASGNTWSFGAQSSGNWYAVLLNGTEEGQGALQLIFNGGNLYVEGGDFSSWWEWNGSGFTQVSGDPRGGSCGGGGVQPNGVSAPSGYHWTTTFDDEFTQDSGLNTNYWNAGASNTDWCDVTMWGRPGGNYMFNEDPNNPCDGSNPGSLSFDSTNGLTMTSNGSPSGAIQTSNKFMQVYGFWEASFKEPTMSDGGTQSHSDFWMHPIPEGVDPRSDGQSELVDWCPEFDVGERPTWLGSGNNNTQMSFGVADGPTGSGNGNNGTYAGDCCGDDLSQNFHTYAMWWNNDGSGPYGSIQMYLDGSPIFGSPYVLNSDDTNMPNGIYMFLSLDNDANDSGNPFVIQYVRVWQLNSN